MTDDEIDPMEVDKMIRRKQPSVFPLSKLGLFCFLLVILFGKLCFFVSPAFAQLAYGIAYDEIGTFQTPTGNWCFWMGWDATFSETYTPTNETYAWVVYFAPEAIYVAQQSGKGLYSAVNVNVGLDYFYGGMNIVNDTKVKRSLLKDHLRSVTFSRNAFDVSGGIPGTGAFAQLSFSISTGLTFLKEKSTGVLMRGIQPSYGLSLALDLISLPLPLSVSLGIDREPDDPPELGQFYGFYPLLIWELSETTTQNPIDLMVSKLTSDTSGPSPGYPQPVSTKTMQSLLLKALQTIQSYPSFREFVESQSKDSQFDDLIDGTQVWLDSGNTSHLDLPQSLHPPDPETAAEMKTILSATQLAFEVAYTRPAQDHTVYADCVKNVQCQAGRPCRIEVDVEEILPLIDEPSVDPADLNGVWVGFETTQESYLRNDRLEWVQIQNGTARYEFTQNTDTPIILGIHIRRYDLPDKITGLEGKDKNLELCRRYVTFDKEETERTAMPWVPLLLLNQK